MKYKDDISIQLQYKNQALMIKGENNDMSKI